MNKYSWKKALKGKCWLKEIRYIEASGGRNYYFYQPITILGIPLAYKHLHAKIASSPVVVIKSYSNKKELSNYTKAFLGTLTAGAAYASWQAYKHGAFSNLIQKFWSK